MIQEKNCHIIAEVFFCILSCPEIVLRYAHCLLFFLELMQVFDFTVFPEAEYDVPIFCANFFTSAKSNIVVL